MTPRPITGSAARFRMRSIHTLIVVAITVLALGALVPSVSAHSAKPFHLSKTCDASGCLVTVSSFKRIPAGTTITYAGSSPDALVATCLLYTSPSPRD